MHSQRKSSSGTTADARQLDSNAVIEPKCFAKFKGQCLRRMYQQTIYYIAASLYTLDARIDKFEPENSIYRKFIAVPHGSD